MKICGRREMYLSVDKLLKYICDVIEYIRFGLQRYWFSEKLFELLFCLYNAVYLQRLFASSRCN